MDLIQEIIEDFFDSLMKDEEIAENLILELKNLWQEEKFDSKEKIMNLIQSYSGV